MCHNKQIIYFKNIYKTNFYDRLKRNENRTHLYSRWAYKWGGGGGLYPGGLISGIKHSVFVGKWMGLYLGGLKTRGGG